MAGFGVKKSCVHQNPLVFPLTGRRCVLFQSIFLAVRIEFWAAISSPQTGDSFVFAVILRAED